MAGKDVCLNGEGDLIEQQTMEKPCSLCFAYVCGNFFG